MDELVVSKRASLDAAHYLPKYRGKCSQMHGHRWMVEVGVKDILDSDSGMVMDFSILKGFLDKVKESLDHKLINEVPRLENPTAENICLYVRDEYYREFGENNLVWVKVWETEDSYALLPC